MKKLLLFALLTVGLTTVFNSSSFSQTFPPPEPPPPSTGPVVSVSVYSADYWGELSFNTFTREFRQGTIYLSSGDRVIIKSLTGTLVEEYRGIVGPDGGYPYGQDWYYHFEGVLAYRFSPFGTTYTLDLDRLNNISLPY